MVSWIFKIPVKVVVLGLLCLIILGAMGWGGYYFFHFKNASGSVLEIPKQDTGKEVSLHTRGKEASLAPAEKSTASDASPSGSEKVLSSPKEVEASPCGEGDKGLTLIITGLGLDTFITERAIRELPSQVVLSFSSYAKMLNQWIQPSKSAGHDILIELNSEADLENFGLVTYFDGIFIKPGKPPVTTTKILREFVITVGEMQKFLVEGRLLKENLLFEEAKHHSIPIFVINQTLTEETLFLDKQEIFSQKGIVTLPASLVPYLIDHMQEKPLKETALQALQEKKTHDTP